MIRVVIEGPAVMGRFNYRVGTEETRLSTPLTGLAADPLLDACRRLKDMGAAVDGAMICLFDGREKQDSQFRERTSVGYGAQYIVQETPSGPKFVRRTPPEGVVAPMGEAAGALKSSEGTEITPEAEKRTPG